MEDIPHRILNVKGNNPWLLESKMLCERLECIDETNLMGTSYIETLEHFIKVCKPARETWEILARKLNWSDLKQQHSMTVLSGLLPRASMKGPINSRTGDIKERQQLQFIERYCVPPCS